MECASPKSPTGGAKDETPPAVVESASTPNKQTNFHEKEITIVFDEWVTIKDILSQLVVSPLMPHEPEVKQKGKGIIIKLPDSLREETTYTINFGNSIADLNEGNVLENYAFVFSTGSVLDSAKLSGIVTDAQSLKPADGVWVMLYPAGEDSAVYKRKPEYLTKTNKEGKWSLENLRTDSFNIVALKDQNLNFLYDQDGESIGWLDEIIYTDLPFEVLPAIWIFPRENRIAVKEVIHEAPGWMKVVVMSPDPKPVPEFVPIIENSLTVWDKDTLHIWYDPQKNYTGLAILSGDTTRIRTSQNPSLATRHTEIKLTSGRLRPGLPAAFISNVPITSIDTSKMTLYHDSLGNIAFEVERDKIDSRRFSVAAPWIGATKYHLTFLPGAISDFWGRSNDTIRQPVVITGADQYGDLMMTIDGLDSTKQYILFLKEGEQIIDTFVILHQTGAHLTKKGLLPGKYILEMIEDLNNNGTWDTGDYDQRRHAEKKKIFTPESLRAGWEQEVKLSWGTTD
jgi:hypothetical protein